MRISERPVTAVRLQPGKPSASGRALVADNLNWSLLGLLQLATLRHIGATAQSPFATWALLAVTGR